MATLDLFHYIRSTRYMNFMNALLLDRREVRYAKYRSYKTDMATLDDLKSDRKWSRDHMYGKLTPLELMECAMLKLYIN